MFRTAVTSLGQRWKFSPSIQHLHHACERKEIVDMLEKKHVQDRALVAKYPKNQNRSFRQASETWFENDDVSDDCTMQTWTRQRKKGHPGQHTHASDELFDPAFVTELQICAHCVGMT